jgi:tetratricopeptide (TPR) repeat protein
MSRLFISHASQDSPAAMAVQQWLAGEGITDVFLDIDHQHGIAAGEAWQQALKQAGARCEAVLCLISRAWLKSDWCLYEFRLANGDHKRIFPLLIEPVPPEELPMDMSARWQACRLDGPAPMRAFTVLAGEQPHTISFSEQGLAALRSGLTRAGLDALSFPWDPAREPYPGLRPLTEADAAVFFGRDLEIAAAIEQVRRIADQQRIGVLSILGASGAGKSSFLRAGLWPRLRRQSDEFCVLHVISPRTAVLTGEEGFARALAAQPGISAPLGTIKTTLAAGNGEALRDWFLSILRAAGGHGTHRTILIGLDQAEEITDPDGAAEAAVFARLLAPFLARAPGGPAPHVVLIATIRSDRYEVLQNLAAWQGIAQESRPLPRFPAHEIARVIEGPAARARKEGVRLDIDPALVDQLAKDASGADGLPLLAFTLRRLYDDFHATRRIDLAQYEAMGGMRGAVTLAVADALRDPGRAPAIPADTIRLRTTLRDSFVPMLATIDPATGLRVRKVARRSAFDPAQAAILARLVEARILVADQNNGTDTIEIAHDRVLDLWPDLAGWLSEAEQDLRAVEAVTQAARQWRDQGRVEAWLVHHGARLQTAGMLTARPEYRAAIGEDGNAYLAACTHVAREAALRERRRARAMRVIAGIAFMLVSAGLLTALIANLKANRNLAAARDAMAAMIDTAADSDAAGHDFAAEAAAILRPDAPPVDERTRLTRAAGLLKASEGFGVPVSEAALEANAAYTELLSLRASPTFGPLTEELFALALLDRGRGELALGDVDRGTTDLADGIRLLTAETVSVGSTARREAFYVRLLRGHEDLGDAQISAAARAGTQDHDRLVAAATAEFAEARTVIDALAAIGRNPRAVIAGRAWIDNKSGDVARANGRFADAARYFTAAAKGFSSLGAVANSNPVWSQRAAITWMNNGSLALEDGQFDSARTAFQAAGQSFSALHDANPHNFDFLSDEVWAQAMTAYVDFLCQADGGPGCATDTTGLLEQTKRLSSWLVASANGNKQWEDDRQNLDAVQAALAGAAAARHGDYHAATVAYDQATRILRQLHRLTETAQREIAEFASRAAVAATAAGDYAHAAAEAQQARDALAKAGRLAGTTLSLRIAKRIASDQNGQAPIGP